MSILCEGFDGQARATARGHGYDGLPVAVTIGHVDAQSSEELFANFIAETVDLVVEGLTGAVDDEGTGSAEPAALDVVASGTIDEIQSVFVQQGWTDGHPVVPPTRERVETLLADSGHDPWKTLGIAVSSGRDLTIWSIAVNAVMAGCRPEHLPVLIALTEILADPGYGVEHSGNTTGADALVVIDGPNSGRLGFNCGVGALREGTHANTAVGRWLRLYLRNVYGFTSDGLDKATFGNPTRVVLAEDMECLAEIGWEPLSAESGFGSGDDVVTMARLNSGTIIGSVFGSEPEELVAYLGNGIARTASWDLSHLHGLGDDQFAPLLVISPILARTCSRAGWSKADLQAALFEQACVPAITFEQMIGQWSNITAGRRRLVDIVAEGALPEVFATSDDPDRLVPVVSRPERILVAVAGDPNRTNAYAFSNDGAHGWWTSKAIDHTPASDLVCQVPEQ